MTSTRSTSGWTSRSSWKAADWPWHSPRKKLDGIKKTRADGHSSIRPGKDDMTRFAGSAWGCVLVSSVSLAAPGAKKEDPPAYFPVAVGATAVYQTTIGDLKMEGTYRVTKAE